MNITEINKGVQALALLLILSMLYCCTDENEHHKISGGKEKLVSFSVGVPGSGTPKTYALNEVDENEVKNIVVLLFDPEGKYIYQPIYINKIITDDKDSKIKTFTAKVPEGTYKHMVLLANSNSIVSNALNEIAVGDPKDEVCSKLLITNNGKWNTSPGSSGYIGIPMWGEINDITVNSAMAENNSVNLVRMVAKVDVVLSATSQTKFKLKSVRLYNNNDKGQVVPDDTNWNTVQNEVIITEPSVPVTAQKMQGPLIYDNNTITTTNVSCVGEIYAFEAVAGTSSTLTENTCLVIGGVYGNDPQEKETFYRVDFSNTTSGNTTYLALLRNHHYRVTITDVSASGLGTPEEAFNSRPVNIKASIIEWDDGRFSDFVVNDQYYLGVSQSEFFFSREAGYTSVKEKYALYIVTDYPGGYNISTVYEDGVTPWLTYSKSTEKIYIKPEENNSLNKRTAELHITAERLTYIVKVTQDILGELDLSIMNEDNEEISLLEFVSTPYEITNNIQPEPKGLKFRWQPCDVHKSRLIYFSNTLGKSFEFGGSQSLGVSGDFLSYLGEKNFSDIRPRSITPEELNTDPFFQRSSIYTFSVTDGIRIKNKTLIFRHSVKRDTVIADVKPYYLLGRAYTFNIRSNTGWRIKSINEEVLGGYTLLNLKEDDNLRVGTMGGYNTNIGTDIHFQTNEKSTHVTGKITLIIESTTTPKSFEDIPITFDIHAEYYPTTHKGWAGSNIYWDGTKLTFDDVGVTTHRQYQGVFFQWGSLYGITSLRGKWSLNMLLYPPSGGTSTPAYLGYTSWGTLPHISDATNIITSYIPSGKSVRDRSYLYETTDEATGLGDICKHLTEKGWAPAGKKWRMPTSAEFDAIANNCENYGENIGGLWIPQTGDVNQTDGRFTVKPGKRSKSESYLYFPAAGYRYNDDGDLSNVGSNGFYWSGSPNNTGNNSYMLDFNKGSINPKATNVRRYAFSVRCVVE
ncbi:FimB/Mfa2 family fimbrial subunit [Dysgonomonas sp. Marseille-P4677]|uniref:FimB/Mfa2 family fimbrial subunit n=1 Tax=Dysgonomonas sp. Marseille-P4677 TaxID=2364790 RepID=UPI001913C6D6|nr:FISUMP domain-containing protein [Dysgonomonas sp. Marseille-P4677]MBK5722597.1 FimB/Mfa2 family fimbrial subunit [Dysgonomonas sp. Marseille-P4677]